MATFYRVPLNIMHKVLACRDRFGMLELTSLVGVNIRAACSTCGALLH